MSSQNQINVEIPKDVIDESVADLQKVRTRLAPYLQGLTVKQRKSIFKMGDKTVPTVQKIDSYVTTNPEFVPPYMNVEEFRKDVAVVNQLEEVFNLSGQIYMDVSDTRMLAVHEGLINGMFYYGMVREAFSRGVASARAIYEDLQARFSRGPYKPRANKE
ncbi:hypothetical protein [Flavobacterium sp. SM2513]|uniref:hypothetical protein n=1 Tax=Flavobacterium sp. SM2513 TaxID=3424766 RepID=UPI003D7F5B03